MKTSEALRKASLNRDRDIVKIGLNYPRSGPYVTQGLDQLRAAELAKNEINAKGGILGRTIEIVTRDSQCKVEVTKKNVTELIEKEGVAMVFGGSASNIAIAAGEICQEQGVIFFGTLTYATDTTGKDGHRHTFRECSDSWMAAHALSRNLKKNFNGGKYFYITADYTWGWTTDRSLRTLTGTEDKQTHRGVLTPFPGAMPSDFHKALEAAKAASPDVLAMVLFGTDMVVAIAMATAMKLKQRMQIVVPNLTLGMAGDAGPENMQGIIGSLPWSWQIPFAYDYPGGKRFVEEFERKYNRYPCTSGASAYAILHEYKNAVERAGTFDAPEIIKALEGHAYTLLKDRQVWRDFDHQSVQTVYAVKCKQAEEVKKDKYQLDYFEIIDSLPGEEAAITREEWTAQRAAAGKPASLEKLPGE